MKTIEEQIKEQESKRAMAKSGYEFGLAHKEISRLTKLKKDEEIELLKGLYKMEKKAQ